MTIKTTIQPLHIATVTLPKTHPDAPGEIPIFVFLLRDGSQNILVDTGIGSGSEIIDRLYSPVRRDLAVELAEMGVDKGAIHAVVNSHLHFDHCGANRLFPGVPIFVQEVEMAEARKPRYTVPEWVDFPGASYRRVRRRVRISQNVEVIHTPGHTRGHQSVIVHTPGGVDLIACQAAADAAEFEAFRTCSGEADDSADDPDGYRRSLEGLHGLSPRRVFFSHDPAIWSRPARLDEGQGG